MKKDNIYLNDLPGSFQFNSQVAEVFPDMINRSVPIYATILEHLPLLANRYIQSNTNVYDLGCSLGAATFALRQALQHKADIKDVKFFAVDTSEAMLERAELKLSAYSSNFPVNFILDDIANIEINNASLVVLNFVLQFIAPEKRSDLLAKIHAGMNPGSVLIFSEKFRNSDPFLEQEIFSLHHDFKRANGYSDLEIQRKRAALENVMITDTMEDHLERLQALGFKVLVWQLGYNFCSFLCFKGGE